MEKQKKTLDELQQEIEKTEGELKYAKQNYRIVQHMKRKLMRNERTRQLCVRGNELNKYLIEPDLLEDEDVFELLKEIFSFPRIRELVKEKVNQAMERITL